MAEEKAEASETQETTTETTADKTDETKVEVTVTTKAKGDETRLSEETDLVTDAETENEGEYKPLFDEEDVFDEAKLTGDEDKEGDEKPDESKDQPADQKAEEEKQAAKESEKIKATEEAETKAKAEEKETEKELKAKEEADKQAAKEKADKKPEKPPEGYVPHAALHETRELLKEEKAARKALEAKFDELVAKKDEPEPVMPDGFKILTDLELDELIEDDPQGAMRYQAKLAKYEKQQATANQSMRDQHREAESVVMTTVDRIEKAVPGIYDGEKTIAKDLADFAIESGFKDEAFLEVMTNPATVVIPAGTDKRVLLSNGAASLIEMLHKIHTSSSSAEGKEVDIEKLRSDIREEETEKIKAEVTKDLLAKLKPEHVPSDYRNIEELPGSQDAPIASNKQYTEAEFARLSEADQEKLLGG